MAELIVPYAAVDVGEGLLESVVEQLIEHAYQHAESAEAFLSSPAA